LNTIEPLIADIASPSSSHCLSVVASSSWVTGFSENCKYGKERASAQIPLSLPTFVIVQLFGERPQH
jgi:hypothetical protein